ncbi:MAG TPA: hypothetical protein VFT31_08220 [Kribbella sp.]|nr:hypothetical protein [Kribbella sp.]
MSSQLGVKATARPDSWNDGGLPAMDLCILMLRDRPVTIGVSALPRQSDSLDRLASAADTPEALPELSAEARVGPTGLVLGASDRAVRITMPSGLDRGTALTLGRVVQAAVPAVVKPARQSDGACQPSGATAEQFLGSRAQLRRDYRVDGALTCIWGTFDGTVSIVESFRPDSIPEARRTPPPKLAPIGNPGYYLPEEGELVFRQGKRVVRIAALTEPARTVNLDELLDIVEPIMPLFIR